MAKWNGADRQVDTETKSICFQSARRNLSSIGDCIGGRLAPVCPVEYNSVPGDHGCAAKLATGQLLRCTVRAADLCCRSGVGTYNWGFTAESSPDNTSILEQEYGTPVAGKRLTNKLARRRCLVRRGGCHTGGQ